MKRYVELHVVLADPRGCGGAPDPGLVPGRRPRFLPAATPPTGMEDAARLARWQADVHARYGAFADALDAAGAFSFSSSPFFLVPLALC